MVKRFPLAAVLLLACVPSVTFYPTNPSPRALAPRPVGEVEVYTSIPPDRPVAEVGLLSASMALRGQHGENLVEPVQFIPYLREEAARRGCDAILVRPSGQASYEGTCLVFR